MQQSESGKTPQEHHNIQRKLELSGQPPQYHHQLQMQDDWHQPQEWRRQVAVDEEVQDEERQHDQPGQQHQQERLTNQLTDEKQLEQQEQGKGVGWNRNTTLHKESNTQSTSRGGHRRKLPVRRKGDGSSSRETS
jgi:hypothetical protein